MCNKQTIPWNTSEILDATRGDLLCGDKNRTFSGVCIDSRRISANELFVAIKGNVHDGHRFVGDVIGKGAGGLIINKDKTGHLPHLDLKKKGIVCVAVNDTTKALGGLAAFNRSRSNVSVIAITGSNGKTTTREMTTAVVARRFNTLSTSGNFNNEIGLPLTLLRLDNSHKLAVLELGMNHPGEIERLGEICSPDIGIITNIGPAHLEGLGSVEGVMHAKGELLGKIKPKGKVILNADDPRALQLANKTSKDILFFGLSKRAQIRALSIKKKGLGNSFILTMPEESVPINLKTPGDFMVSNALAAAAAGYLLGLSAREIKAGLEDFKPVEGRMNILETGRGIHIIDDCYNANPGSMEAAIKTLMSLTGNKRRILVAGDMLELGKHAKSMHKMIGKLAAKSNITRLYVTGRFAESVAAGAHEEDVDFRNIFFGTRKEILEDLKDRLEPGDCVLVKGSRSMGMEIIVQGLKDWAS